MINIFIYNNKIFKRLYINNKVTDFFISEYGDVYNIMTDHFLSPTLDCSGRKTVCLSINGQSISPRIHQLVAMTFIGDIPEDMTIDHINEDFLNNHYSNLQFLSSKDNTLKYLNNNGNIKKKYPDEMIHEICNDLKNGIYYRDLMDKYNVPLLYLYYIVHCKIRRNIVTEYLPFPTESYRKKSDRSGDKELIEDMIKIQYTNSQICKTLGLDHNNANNKLISRIRKELGIKEPKYLDDNLKESVTNLIKSGFSNNEILKMLKIEYNDQIQYLFARTRKKLQIPDFNRDGVPVYIQQEMKELIKTGKSNKEILEKYNLERNKYTINLLGKLRQKVKKKNSTTSA